jgi:hypothetical protein
MHLGGRGWVSTRVWEEERGDVRDEEVAFGRGGPGQSSWVGGHVGLIGRGLVHGRTGIELVLNALCTCFDPKFGNPLQLG